MVKWTVVEDRFWFKTFVQYVAENGKSVYVVSGKLTTREDGNQAFREALEKHPGATVVNNVVDSDDAKILNDLEESIDKYTIFIDNYGQQKAAERENERISEIIAAFEKVAKN